MHRMRNGDVEYFKKYYRMTPHQFDFLLSLLREDLERKHVIREPICPAERLAMTLRRCVENAFGILVTRWRILERAMGECPENAEETVKALCVLHNFLMDARTGSDDFYCGPGYADSVSPQGQRQSGQWRQLVVQPPMQVARTKAHNFACMARYVRDIYLQYFNSAAGHVSWQDAVV
ncbi:hypothetical protein HPB49_015363 [Dermacentor silvarum]|uniref:Uncharacterized protein n=1 Tax=Dermacentor silvarum TaxID=543639 RepID=A0ACB8CG14_DERSI|nr:hypothetical protein HPB49_015363 [Dermacentor silvarum]